MRDDKDLGKPVPPPFALTQESYQRTIYPPLSLHISERHYTSLDKKMPERQSERQAFKSQKFKASAEF